MKPGDNSSGAPNDEFDQAHRKAIKAENRVNGNTRVASYGSLVFTEKDGSKTKQVVSSTSTGGINVVKTKIK